MRRITSVLRLTCLLVLIATQAGCGDGTYPVSGTVTVAGQPLKTGKILLSDPGMHYDAEVANVVDGTFQLRAREGKKRVEIRCGVWTGEIGHFGGKITDEGLPKRYNTESQLTCAVSRSGPNVFTFELDDWEKWAKKRHP